MIHLSVVFECHGSFRDVLTAVRYVTECVHNKYPEMATLLFCNILKNVNLSKKKSRTFELSFIIIINLNNFAKIFSKLDNSAFLLSYDPLTSFFF